MDVDQLPPEIRNTSRAVLWNFEKRDGKETKVPYRPGRPAEKAAVNDPKTWGSFNAALANVEDGKADGLGFVLGDGIAGVDFDGCRDPDTGEIHPDARQIVDDLDSYTEVSPSGTGLKTFVRGTNPEGRNRTGNVPWVEWNRAREIEKDPDIEFYDAGSPRYFTVTGEHVEGTPRKIEERTAELAALHARVFGTNGAGTETTDTQPPTTRLSVSDQELIEKAQAAENGSKFTRLWSGDTTGYDSHSEADLALVNLLAFWCRGDTERIDSLFRRSGLMRKKWEREDYRTRTMGAAMDGCTEFYEPNPRARGATANHLDAGHTLEDFRPVGEEDQEEGLPTPIRALDAEAPEPPQFLVQDMILENEVGLFVGQGGDWKTTSALILGGCVAGEYPVFDSTVFQARQGPVLFVSNEDGLGVLLNRLEALIRGHGWEREQVLGNVYFLAQEGTSLDSAEWQEHLTEFIREKGIRLVIFDPYAELTTVPENSNDDLKGIVRYWRQLNSETGATVLVVHHAGKKSEGKGKLDRIRGASALNAAARYVYFFEQSELGISIECLKLSRAEPPPKFLVQAEVEADPDNRASWTKARLSYVSEHSAQDIVAEDFVLRTLTAEPGPTSTQMKNMGSKEGIDPREVSEALQNLRETGKIDYEVGKYNSHKWHLRRVALSGVQPS